MGWLKTQSNYMYLIKGTKKLKIISFYTFFFIDFMD